MGCCTSTSMNLGRQASLPPPCIYSVAFEIESESKIPAQHSGDKVLYSSVDPEVHC